MRLSIRFVAPAAAALIWLAAGATTGRAQPEPSFRASCADLRAATESLPQADAALVTIEVVGRLTHVESDGALAYLAMCSSPDPQVLCVTYSAGGYQAGDKVALAGAFSRRGPDHVLLDPCLAAPVEE